MAILSTYFASTMLHGLNFQLGAVLFSLGFYTYVEHTVRAKLAVIFDASVEASVSPSRAFRHNEGSGLTLMVNTVFGLLAIFNLAYLGVMFNQDNTMAEGYSWQHTMKKWEELGFLSRYVMGLIAVKSFLN